jgi:hypothetical protein
MLRTRARRTMVVKVNTEGIKATPRMMALR